jgi:hypothetical protein
MQPLPQHGTQKDLPQTSSFQTSSKPQTPCGHFIGARCWLGAGKFLWGAVHEDLGGHDRYLDRTEKMELGTEAVQICDSVVTCVTGESPLSFSHTVSLIVRSCDQCEDVDGRDKPGHDDWT